MRIFFSVSCQSGTWMPVAYICKTGHALRHRVGREAQGRVWHRITGQGGCEAHNESQSVVACGKCVVVIRTLVMAVGNITQT